MSPISFYAVVSGCLSIALSQPAYAYLDPGTGSIILQGIMGAIAGGLVLGRGYLMRFKSRFGFGGNVRKPEQPHAE